MANNRLWLKASIDIDRHLPLQAISFRGQDESFTSTNRENFLTTLDLILGYNNNVVKIMTKAPKKMPPIHHLIFKKKFYMLFQPKWRRQLGKKLVMQSFAYWLMKLMMMALCKNNFIGLFMVLTLHHWPLKWRYIICSLIIA